jgi:hypothetical protein
MPECPYCGRKIPKSDELSREVRDGVTTFVLNLCYQVDGWGNWKTPPAEYEIVADVCNSCFKDIRREAMALITRLEKPLKKGGDEDGRPDTGGPDIRDDRPAT